MGILHKMSIDPWILCEAGVYRIDSFVYIQGVEGKLIWANADEWTFLVSIEISQILV